MRSLCSLTLANVAAFALSVADIRQEAAGYAKDLFLLELLKKSHSKEEVYEAYFLTKSPKSDHASLLLKKSDSKKLSKLFDCMDSNTTRAVKKEPECAELGINYKKISAQLLQRGDEITALRELIKETAPKKAEKIELLERLSTARQKLDSKTLDIYFEASKEFRAAFFNLELSKEELELLANSRYTTRFIKWVLFDGNASKLQKSVATLDPKLISNSEALFFLALTKLKCGENPIESLQKAADCANNDTERNRANFWSYLVSGGERWLKKAAATESVDFYSQIAKEMLGDQNGGDIKFVSATNGTKIEKNITSPFYWQEFRKKVKKANSNELDAIIAETQKIKDGEAYYLYAKNKQIGYRKELMLLPYKEAFFDMNDSQKLLLHAIGRQESLFIPGVVSSAYAIGVMQIIPLLADEIAKKRGESIDLFELFEPKKNISFAATHFRWLESKVSHPTLIAISYNAGYGFFKRIEKNGLFTFDDKKMLPYEPFWSIENIPYDETRNYAKKVSLNYAIYSKKFGDKTTLKELLKNLVKLRRPPL